MLKHGQVCWAELATDDLAGAKSFYSDLFGWNFKGGQADGGGMEYSEFSVGEGYPMGGMYQKPAEMPAPPHWMTYVSVDDVDASAAKAAELGGSMKVPPMDIPNVGRFAVLTDPSGATFAIVKLDPHGEAA
jgi:uncharacterized protein